jgi:hypothetical protein
MDNPPYLKAAPIATSSSGDWQEISLTFNSGPSSSIVVNFDAFYVNGEVLRIDDVSLTEQPDVLAHPVLQAAAAGDGQVSLSWTGPCPCDHAIWRMEANAVSNFTELLATVPQGTTNFVDYKVTNGHSYSYQIAAIDGQDQYSFSNRVYASPSPSSDLHLVQFFTFIDGPSHVRNNFDGYVGLQFTTGDTPLTITQLGRWTPFGTIGDHDVALFDQYGNLLESVNVPAPTGDYRDFQQFRYEYLGYSVLLLPHTSYILGSRERAGGDIWLDWDNVVNPTGVATIDQAADQPLGGNWSLFGGTNNSFGPVDFIANP